MFNNKALGFMILILLLLINSIYQDVSLISRTKKQLEKNNYSYVIYKGLVTNKHNCTLWNTSEFMGLTKEVCLNQFNNNIKILN